MPSSIIQSIIKELLQTLKRERVNLDHFKRKVSRKYKIPLVKNSLLIEAYHKMVKNGIIKRSKSFENLVRIRPVRSLSGIVNVSVLTAPHPCGHKCLYCPRVKTLPKSYLYKEPAVQRAVFNNFHPWKQVINRLKSLKATGHPLDKIELRIIGATWSYYPKNYQNWFVRECFRAANEFEGKKIKRRSLENLQRLNEKSKHKIVGITVETRPDCINENEIKQMRKLGITRVELGVQSVFDDVLKLIKRGHTTKEIIYATKMLKDAGFKVCYQVMPNLPGSNFQRDIKMFKILFSHPDFRPDLLKIYPLAILKSAPLYKWYQKGKLKIYDQKELTALLVEIKKIIPHWVRIQRIVRDFPSSEILEGGVKTSNLREIVQRELKNQNLKCNCIRCREVKGNFNPSEKMFLFKTEYQASGGKEIFLSFENKTRTKLFALLRLRYPREVVFKELKNCALVRELHTYGQTVPVGEKISFVQHRGLGKKLMKKAEKIAFRAGFKKIAVIAGVGTRNYYRKLGYRLKGTYMIKTLK